MANISWSLVVPAIIALLCVNAIITICVSSLKDVDGKHRVANIAIAVGAVLVFISLFCILTWLMYSTPARFIFEEIDRLINGVVSGLPKFLAFLWFILPLSIVYMIFAFVSTFYEHRKRKEYAFAEESKKKASKAEEKVTKEDSIDEKLESFVNHNDVTKAIELRRLINAKENGISGVQYANSYWLIAHNPNEFSTLKEALPSLLKNQQVVAYPAVVNATIKAASVMTEQHAINTFRKLTRKVN